MGRRHKKGIKKELTTRGHKAEALDIMERVISSTKRRLL